MLNTRKLLFILPDVAYIAELLPAKKEHTFAIQAFRQINGEFLTEDDDLIADNIEKLFSKIEPETYHLILPDFLFTNTILEIKETQEAKVKQYIKEKLLPSLELSKESHEIETFILTQYGNVTKIQLTALEKEVLAPIAQSAANHKIDIAKISPLSWAIKSVISLEPSISVIQIGSMLYVAEHYIGVDQCTMAKTDEIDNVGETIKTLKGAQPSIQTIYLMTNTLVEEKLKELASSTLPIQQLATFKEDQSQMPSYVKQIIESSMRTLDISDYPVPSFSLPKVEAIAVKEIAMPSDKPRALDVFDEEEAQAEIKETPEEKTEERPSLAPVMKLEVEEDDEPEPEILPEPSPVPELAEPDEAPAMLSTPVAIPALDTGTVKPFTAEVEESPEENQVESEEKNMIEGEEKSSSEVITTAKHPLMSESQSTSQPKPEIIKNKAGTGAWFKMLLVMISVFAVTVAVGVGIGLLVLNLTSQPDSEVATASPSPVVSVAPSPIPSPSPEAEDLDRSQFSILVVNATTKAGYAGGTRSKLETAGYEEAVAANAKGDYEPGLYVLMPKENTALVTALKADTGLDLVYETGYETEDPQGQYAAVVVLAE